MTDDQMLDGDRSTIDDIGGRTILDECGALQPHIDEIDAYCTLPLRITHNALSGITLEIGPFNFSGRDIQALRAALDGIDRIEQTGPWRACR